jgi:hypothetical protein
VFGVQARNLTGDVREGDVSELIDNRIDHCASP